MVNEFKNCTNDSSDGCFGRKEDVGLASVPDSEARDDDDGGGDNDSDDDDDVVVVMIVMVIMRRMLSRI